MLSALQHQDNLTLMQGEIAEIYVENGKVTGVRTTTGMRADCRVCVLCTGVYLKSRIIIGEFTVPEGPTGLQNATHLSQCLTGLGFALRRFKTGTPARVDIRTVDLSKLEHSVRRQPCDALFFFERQDRQAADLLLSGIYQRQNP
jgi:tRNA uridine 5-carboxymethylaminomethyl modification enzyme